MEIEIAGGGADVIDQEELRALSDQYKRIAGYSIEELATPAARSAT